MKRHQKTAIKQRQKFAIRKLNVGIASVLFGTFCYLGHSVEAQAAESTNNETVNQLDTQQNDSQIPQKDNEATHTPQKNNEVVNEQSNNSAQSSEKHKNKSHEEPNHTKAQPSIQTNETKTETNTESVNTAPQVTNNKVNDTQQPNKLAKKEQQKSQSATQKPHTHVDNQRKSAQQPANTNNVSSNDKAQKTTKGTVKVKRSADNQPSTPQSTPKATFNETIILPQTNARPVQVNEVREQVYRKSVNVLKVGKKAQTLGASRGINQARDSLGFIIPANTNLYVRQLKNNNAGNLRVNLVTNDSHFNKTATVNSNGAWTAIKTTIDSAAFVYMPRGLDKEPLIEYYVENNLGRALPTYRKGWNQKLFEKRWVEEDSSYAYVDGTHIGLLIPKMDRQLVLNMKNNKKDHQFKNLNELITYYNDFITHYNKWTGLTDDINSVNFNNESKYFAVANRHGAGLAYYTGDHIATNSPSIKHYLTKGWLALHEVGHGYDGIMTNDARIPLLEVWNNIFANQYEKYVEKKQSGWLYGNNQRKYQEGIHKRMLQNNLKYDIHKATLKERLEFMTRMVRFTGIEGLTAMLQDVREEISKKPTAPNLPKWFSEKWLSKYNANILAYFDLYKIPVTKDVKDKVESLQQTYVFPLALLINDNEERQRYVKKLGLATEYELVRSADLADTKVKTNAQVNLQLNGHSIPSDAVVKLVDGEKVVAAANVHNGIANFEGIRPGIYKIVAPYSATKSLPDHAYLIVREGNANHLTVSYPNINAKQRFYSQRLSLKGLGDKEFMSIDYKPENATVTLHKNSGVPHSYFTGEYAHVKIVKANGNVLLDESIVGKNSLSSKVQKFELAYGDKVIVKHKEPGARRVLLRNETNTTITAPFYDEETVTYTLTSQGFKINQETDFITSNRYTTAIVEDIRKFEKEISNNPNGDYRVRLSNLVQSINHIDEQYREMILKRVKPYLDRFNLS